MCAGLPSEVVFSGGVGLGGHSYEIAKRLGAPVSNSL